MTLLAILNLLFMRLSGQDDIVVGSTIAGRTRPEFDGVIGFFVNALALRTDLSGDPPFLESLRRVREICLDAYGHQDLRAYVTDARGKKKSTRSVHLRHLAIVLVSLCACAPAGPPPVAPHPVPAPSPLAQSDPEVDQLLRDLRFATASRSSGPVDSRHLRRL